MAVKNLQPLFILIAFAAIILYCILDGCVLFLLTKTKYKSYSFFRALKTSMIGLFYSAITPLSVGGQPMQIVEMAHSKIEFGDASSFVIVKMIIYQIALILYAQAAIFLCPNFDVPKFWFFTASGFLLNIIFIGIIVFMSIKKDLVIKICTAYINFFSHTKFFRIKNPDLTLQNSIKQINLFHKSTKLISRKKVAFIFIFFVTFIQLTIYYLIPYLVLKSFGIDNNIYRAIFATSLIYMITAFVPIPGAIMANEGAFYIFFKVFISKSFVVPIIFIWRFITYYFLILIGGIIIITDMTKNSVTFLKQSGQKKR